MREHDINFGQEVPQYHLNYHGRFSHNYDYTIMKEVGYVNNGSDVDLIT